MYVTTLTMQLKLWICLPLTLRFPLQPNDHYVHIHTLKSQSDGGILDLDDLLSDVVDDRDQVRSALVLCPTPSWSVVVT